MPVLGALFRSVQYQKNETELVVLVTPVLVHGIDPADVTPVPGEKWRDPNSRAVVFPEGSGRRGYSATAGEAALSAEHDAAI